MVESRTTNKEGKLLFNDALNTFYLRLYGVGQVVKDQIVNARKPTAPPHGLLFPISSQGSFRCTPFHRQNPLLLIRKSSLCSGGSGIPLNI